VKTSYNEKGLRFNGDNRLHKVHPAMFEIGSIRKCHITQEVFSNALKEPHYCDLVMRVALLIVIGPCISFVVILGWIAIGQNGSSSL
jgi:ABC-type uncharacterized transport system permease subunit